MILVSYCSYPLTYETTCLHSLVLLSSGDPAEGVRGGSEAAGETDIRGGKNKAAGAGTEEEGYG